MTSPIMLSSSIVVPSPAAVRLKRCTGCRNPPTSAAAPNTSSTLPIIEPVSEAFTRSVRPACSASAPMISSAALPNVAFSSPPMPPPRRSASDLGGPADVRRQRQDGEHRGEEDRDVTLRR